MTLALCLWIALAHAAAAAPEPELRLWYAHPAEKWQNALPVGNGRLGAMVFGRTDEERIQLNEDTYWTGGPYSTTVKGASNGLAEIRRLIFRAKAKSPGTCSRHFSICPGAGRS